MPKLLVGLVGKKSGKIRQPKRSKQFPFPLFFSSCCRCSWSLQTPSRGSSTRSLHDRTFHNSRASKSVDRRFPITHSLDFKTLSLRTVRSGIVVVSYAALFGSSPLPARMCVRISSSSAIATSFHSFQWTLAVSV